MNAVKGFNYFVGLVLLLTISQPAIASEGKPVVLVNNCCNISLHFTDTLPQKINGVENGADKPAADIIRAVPKARRQVVPVPVNIGIKPPTIITPKIVTPKIIKPIIKLIH